MQQNNSKQSNQSEIEFNFIEIVRILLNSKRLIVLTTIAVGVIGWLYSSYFYTPPPPNFSSSSIVEIGSYTASDEKNIILIASMEATTGNLNNKFGSFDKLLIHGVSIYELDSQFLKIEVIGATLDLVQNKTNEIIKYVKTLHDSSPNDLISKSKRELINIEEKLLTIEKIINFIDKDKNVYLSVFADLKLKELDLKYELTELSRYVKNIESFKKTDLVGKTEFQENYPKFNKTKLTFASFIMGFILSLLFVFIRHGLISNYKE